MTVNGDVSFWWAQLGGTPAPRAALPGSLEVDVCIVGGGYTGLWTAYYLARAQPDLRIAVLEQRFAGFGASGRNGGWLTNSVTGGREQYVRSHGRDAAIAQQRALNDTVDEVVAVAAREGIDADIVKGGELNVARSPAQLARLRAAATAERAWPATDVVEWDAAATRSRIAVAGAIGGLWHPHAARIHAAKLASGLAAVVERLGVRIYEDTHVTEIAAGRAITDRGVVHRAVRAAGDRGLHARSEGPAPRGPPDELVDDRDRTALVRGVAADRLGRARRARRLRPRLHVRAAHGG